VVSLWPAAMGEAAQKIPSPHGTGPVLCLTREAELDAADGLPAVRAAQWHQIIGPGTQTIYLCHRVRGDGNNKPRQTFQRPANDLVARHSSDCQVVYRRF
jgi:hypothetical protein